MEGDASIVHSSQSHSLLLRRLAVGATEHEGVAVTVTYTVDGVHVPDKEAIVEEDIVEFEVKLTLEVDEVPVLDVDDMAVEDDDA